MEFEEGECGNGGDNSPITASSKVIPLSSSSASSSSSSSPIRYIEHHVTKLDTLAGIAIRYGVEVADIKKMNGLVTDLQMFALKTLHIPLPGRHPPSPCLSNGYNTNGQSSSERTPHHHIRSDLLESFQSLRETPERKVSPAMSSLLSHYGLNDRRNSCGSTSYHEHESFTTTSSLKNPPLSHHRRSRSLANNLNTEEGELGNDHEWIDKLKKRHQKSEAEFTRTPEKLLKEENNGGWFSAITGKGLALRTKATSRISLGSQGEANGFNGFSSNLWDFVVAQTSSSVRKSSSTSSLQDQASSNSSSNSSSIWSTSKWSLKPPDLQAALSKPIFDGFPKPITGRRAKAS